jgi:predicted transglutaminase-like cysteine proteinase
MTLHTRLNTRQKTSIIFSRARRKSAISSVLILSLFWFPHLAWSSFVSDAMLNELKSKYGKRAYERGIKLMGLLAELKTADTRTKLTKVNDFFNAYPYRTDAQLWKQEDYWATPTEFIGLAGGDCEDYVISKYFVLRSLDVPEEKLHLAYVKSTSQNLEHMVVNYFDTPSSAPLVLDNYNPEILPASQRPDLERIYSFPVNCQVTIGDQSTGSSTRQLSCRAQNKDAVVRW